MIRYAQMDADYQGLVNVSHSNMFQKIYEINESMIKVPKFYKNSMHAVHRKLRL